MLSLLLYTQSQFIRADDATPAVEIGFVDKHIQNLSKDENSADIDKKVLTLALCNYKNAIDSGLTKSHILSVVDFSKASGNHRLWVIDLNQDKVLFRELVAHGKNSGDNEVAKQFSNRHGSLQSSLGLFLTGHTYNGIRGRSLKLHGLEKGINDNALSRGVVVHGASYVNENRAKKLGHVGRSHGCLSVRKDVNATLIDTIKGGSVVYAYHPNLLA